ncbi:PEP-CTERM sorting domain-containing protein [Aeoliella sp.]|uniref:PEP-CTERM sorting domain-containing protein n=1 Tax=Aeoliella sp. TaxID=2795800 RepID=UPI003CCBBC49
MSLFNRTFCSYATLVALFALANQSFGQVEYEFQPTEGIADWNTDSNWLGDGTFVFVPDIDAVGGAGDTAYVGTDATAQISSLAPRVGQLNIDSSSVLIDQNGSLDTAISLGSSGAVILARPDSVLEMRDSATLNVGTVLSSVGEFHVYGPSVTATAAAGILMNGGTLGAHITSASHSTITTAGSADLSGTLLVDVSGVTPTQGMTWDLVTATGGIEKMFEQVVVENTPALTNGLQYQAVQSGNTAQLRVGATLVATVDRLSGDVTISNPVGTGFEIASYALRSAGGALSPAGAISFNDNGVSGTGWLGSPATNQLIAEVKPSSTYTMGMGQSVGLGAAYTVGLPPGGDDLTLDFTTTGGEVFSGIVEYTGPVNDFVLFVDPTDGSAALGNLSPFITAPDVTGYAVLSPGDQLTTGTWNTLESSGEAGSGWDASPALISALTETNLEGSFSFGLGVMADLGQIFTPAGTEDLQFLYTVAGDPTARVGTVIYGDIPTVTPILAGDYNNDNVVNLADYVVWRNNLGGSGLPNDVTPGSVTTEDYNIWKSNFGQTLSGAASVATVQSVPEPSTVALVGLLSLIGCTWRRRS